MQANFDAIREMNEYHTYRLENQPFASFFLRGGVWDGLKVLQHDYNKWFSLLIIYFY